MSFVCYLFQAEDHKARLQEEKTDFGRRRGQRRCRIRARTHIRLQVNIKPNFF